MTEQEKKIQQAAKLVKEAVGDEYCGSVEFHIMPCRKKTKVTYNHTELVEEVA